MRQGVVFFLGQVGLSSVLEYIDTCTPRCERLAMALGFSFFVVSASMSLAYAGYCLQLRATGADNLDWAEDETEDRYRNWSSIIIP